MFVPFPPESIASSKSSPQTVFDTSFGRCPQTVRSIDCAPAPAWRTVCDAAAVPPAVEDEPRKWTPAIDVAARVETPVEPNTLSITAVDTPASQATWQRTDAGHASVTPPPVAGRSVSSRTPVQSVVASAEGPPKLNSASPPQTPFADWYDPSMAWVVDEVPLDVQPESGATSSPDNVAPRSSSAGDSPSLSPTPTIARSHIAALTKGSRSNECTWRWPRVVDELVATQWPLVNRLGHSALAASRDETQRILVTGAQRGVGKTTIALTLARWAAMTRERVLLIEADFRHPKLAFRLGLAPHHDWRRSTAWKTAVQTLSADRLEPTSKSRATAESGRTPGYEECLIHCDTLPISVLPLATLPLRDMPARHMMEQLMLLISLAEQEFDCCVIDGGPISDLITQIDAVSRLASSIVVVNSIQAVGQSELTLACNELWRRGCPSLTIAENKSTTIRA